jgi:CheY-like chemotaxis protein
VISYEKSDSTMVTLDPGTARILDGLRLLVVAHDRERGEILADMLRTRRADVIVATPDTIELDDARVLDPEVVLLDPERLGAAGLSVTRALNSDPRLRWASVLRTSWTRFWPYAAQTPDLQVFAGLVAPLVEAERSLRQRARTEKSLITELDRVGPNRVLRTLIDIADGAFRLVARCRSCTVASSTRAIPTTRARLRSGSGTRRSPRSSCCAPASSR